MDAFDKIAGAKTNNSGVYFLPLEGGGTATYSKVWLDRIKMEKSWEGHDCFITETVVLESNCPARGPGSKPASVLNLTKNKMAAGDAKAIVAAALNCPEEQVTADVLRRVCGPDNPLRGRLIQVECTEIMVGKNKDKPFNKLVFSGLPDDIQAQAKELAAPYVSV